MVSFQNFPCDCSQSLAGWLGVRPLSSKVNTGCENTRMGSMAREAGRDAAGVLTASRAACESAPAPVWGHNAHLFPPKHFFFFFYPQEVPENLTTQNPRSQVESKSYLMKSKTNTKIK